jgi:hypothetical protein
MAGRCRWPRPCAQRRRVRPGAAGRLLPEYVGRSVPGLPCPQPGQVRHAHRRPPAGGGGRHQRADLRQLPGPVIVILRSHPASLHANAEQIHAHAAGQGRPPGQLLNAHLPHTVRQLRHDPAVPRRGACFDRTCPANRQGLPGGPGRTRTGATTGLKGALVDSNTLREGEARENARGAAVVIRWLSPARFSMSLL